MLIKRGIVTSGSKEVEGVLVCSTWLQKNHQLNRLFNSWKTLNLLKYKFKDTLQAYTCSVIMLVGIF